MAVDALIDAGGKPAELSADTIDEAGQGPAVDLVARQPGRHHRRRARQPLRRRAQRSCSRTRAPMPSWCSIARRRSAPATEAASAVIDTIGGQPTHRPDELARRSGAPPRRVGSSPRIASRPTTHPSSAVRGFMHLVRYRRNQELLLEAPPSIPEEFAADTEAARTGDPSRRSPRAEAWLIGNRGQGGARSLRHPRRADQDCRRRRPQRRAKPRRSAAPVALKILSPDITHKSDVGGVALDLGTPGAVREAAEAMLERVRGAAPGRAGSRASRCSRWSARRTPSS